MVDQELCIDAEEPIEQRLVIIVPGLPDGAARDIAHGVDADGFELLCIALSDTPEVGQGAVCPKLSAVAHFIQLRDPDAALIRRDVFGHDVHSDLAKIKVCADPRGRGDPRCAQHIKDHGSSQFPRRHVIRPKITGGVDHHLIDGVDMDVLRGDVFEVDVVDLGADLDILCHPGRCYDIVNSQSRVRFQIHGICAFACKLSSGSMALPLRIDFSDPLYHFKKTGSAEYTIGFQRRRDCKAYRLLGAADICHHKVCCHRVKAARHALHGRVIRL